jgi:hypothetical protein
MLLDKNEMNQNAEWSLKSNSDENGVRPEHSP